MNNSLYATTDYKSPTAWQSFKKWAAIEIKVTIPHQSRKHPVLATLAGTALSTAVAAAAYNVVTSPARIHEHFVRAAALETMADTNSAKMSVQVFGIESNATLMAGVVKHLDAQPGSSEAALDAVIQKYVPPGESAAGCKTSVWTVNHKQSNWLSHVFSSPITVSTFTPAFRQGFVCVPERMAAPVVVTQ